MFKITESGESNVINDSGEYTPVYQMPGTNVTVCTTEPCQWLRVGDRVLVSGSIVIDPTTAAVLTYGNISLPIPSDFTLFGQLSGAGSNNLAGGGIIAWTADTTDNAAQFSFTPTVDTSKRYQFIFMYQVR